MPDAVAVSIARLPHANGLELPSYQTPHAAGMDLFAAIDAPVTLQPGQRVAIPCGFIMALPEGYEGQIRPRSGLAFKSGISVPNAPGTIDADYRGEVKALLINLSNEPFVISRGMRIAQLVIAPVSRAQWKEFPDSSHLPDSTRGAGGFGSTGS